MTGQALLLVTVAAFLAYANGANDVSKGIATLVGSGVTDYRRAIVWGTVWTAVGGVLGAVFGGAMLATFGNGLLAPGATPTFAAALAALIGAATWVLLATRTGLPVSTTHALVGSLVGVAAAAYGVDAVRWSALGGKVFLPLLVSPLVSFLLTRLALRASQERRGGANAADCLCADIEPAIVAVPASTAASAALIPGTASLRITTGATEACAVSQPMALRLTLDHLHWLSSGLTSLARGMNDAPKMVGLTLVASSLMPQNALSPMPLFALVTVGMVVGSLRSGRCVTQVLAEKVTTMDHREGLVANLLTAGLVTTGAIYGLPMSTTHVSSGAIAGSGVERRALNQRMLRDIALAWIVTLPGAALLGMAGYALTAALLGS